MLTATSCTGMKYESHLVVTVASVMPDSHGVRLMLPGWSIYMRSCLGCMVAEGNRNAPRMRLRWTKDLDARFHEAVNDGGGLFQVPSLHGMFRHVMYPPKWFSISF